MLVSDIRQHEAWKHTRQDLWSRRPAGICYVTGRLSPVLKAFCFKTLDAQGIIEIPFNTLKLVIWNAWLSLYINQDVLHLRYGYNQPPDLRGQTPKKKKKHPTNFSVMFCVYWWSFIRCYCTRAKDDGVSVSCTPLWLPRWGAEYIKTLCCLLKRFRSDTCHFH